MQNPRIPFLSTLGAGLALSALSYTSFAQEGSSSASRLFSGNERDAIEEITVTSRRREELAQDVPIPLSVIDGETLEEKGAFNVSRLQELRPSLQFFSSNPRNTAVNIRGIGAPFGLTNDGIEPGVGVYVDGIYHARPASTTFDFIDVERVEVLRGPQGTLYGKNTTSGAINLTTRSPAFVTEGKLETSYGDWGFQQTRGYITGPLGDNVAARLSFSGTRRDGTIRNEYSGTRVNDLNNQGIRAQVLFDVSRAFRTTLHADYNRQRLACCTQVFAGVAPTHRPAERRYEQIAADLDFSPPSTSPFDRVTSLDSPIQAHQDIGGLGLVADWDIGRGTLTSITAWRYWNWYPSNDRDFTDLPITTVSANPSKQRQWTQEFRYAGELNTAIDYVAGIFLYRQTIKSVGNQEQGSAAARWLLAPAETGTPPNTPELLDGLYRRNDIGFENDSYAVFAQADWRLNDSLTLTPGIRLNHDAKETGFNSMVTGGLQTDDPALTARKDSILQSQTYRADSSDSDISGQLTLSYALNDNANLYGSYARSFKSVGVNLSGIPNGPDGTPALATAEVKPERVSHLELGLKSTLLDGRLLANVNLFDTTINDYQVNVVNNAVGVLRGYLANAEEVNVKGLEAELQYQPADSLSLYFSATFTDGEYEDFMDAPCPLELSGAPGGGVCDVSGQDLPGISDTTLSAGLDYRRPASFLGLQGEAFAGLDFSYRSAFSSSASPSRYLVVDGYTLTNLRLGFRREDGWELFAWTRNAFDEEYFEFLSAQSGSSGMYVGQLGDPRTAGVTLNLQF